jgi:hypothetical protein
VKTCSDCGGNLKFDKQVPDGDPNGTTLDQYVCEDCGAIEVED